MSVVRHDFNSTSWYAQDKDKYIGLMQCNYLHALNNTKKSAMIHAYADFQYVATGLNPFQFMIFNTSIIVWYTSLFDQEFQWLLYHNIRLPSEFRVFAMKNP